MSSTGHAVEVGRTAVRCQLAIAKAATGFATNRLADLGRCASTVLDCVEGAPGDTACLDAARQGCMRKLSRFARREQALARTIATRCEAVDPAVLRDPAGFGFAALAPLCPVLDTEDGDAAAIATCLVSHQRCGSERLVGNTVPRAGELLRVAGVPSSVRAALGCLRDRGGSGFGAGESGLAVARCVRKLERAGVRLGERMVTSLRACASRAFPCLTGSGDDPTCVPAASFTCERAFHRINQARRAIGQAVDAACGDDALTFEDLAGPDGAGLAALTDACATVGLDEIDSLPPLVACLTRLSECEVASMVRTAIPRADEMFELVGQQLGSPLCPVPEPLPTPTAIVTGPTRTPQPGETATPSPSPTPTLSRTATPRPTPTPVCGNGIVEDGEECDGLALDDYDCEFLCDEVGPNPQLKCSNDCRFDFSSCQGIDCEAP